MSVPFLTPSSNEFDFLSFRIFAKNCYCQVFVRFCFCVFFFTFIFIFQAILNGMWQCLCHFDLMIFFDQWCWAYFVFSNFITTLYLFRYFPHFNLCLFFTFKSSLKILDRSYLAEICFENIYSSVACCFIILNRIFCMKNIRF